MMMDEGRDIGSINLLRTEIGGSLQLDASLMNDRKVFITRITIRQYDHQYIKFNL
jgi:hypothetical protein